MFFQPLLSKLVFFPGFPHWALALPLACIEMLNSQALLSQDQPYSFTTGTNLSHFTTVTFVLECQFLHHPAWNAVRNCAGRAQSLPAQQLGTHATLYKAEGGRCCRSEHPNVKLAPHFTVSLSLPRIFAGSWVYDAVRYGSHCTYRETCYRNAAKNCQRTPLEKHRSKQEERSWYVF